MTITIFRNCTIFDGHSPELSEGRYLVVEDERIREISMRPPKISGAREIDVRGKTLMPGLIDAHVHVNVHKANLLENDALPDSIRTLHSRVFMESALARGFTTLRDAGGADRSMHDALEMGLINGPRLFYSGRAISQTGGHGDFRQAHRMAYCSCGYAGSISVLADGVDAVRAAAREELRLGAHQVKVMASGGVASPSDGIHMLQYTDAELSAAVEEAKRFDTYVMAHAYTPEAIARCIRLGVRSIEHGNMIDTATARAVVEKQAFVVPTLVTYKALADHGRLAGFPEVSLRKLDEVKDAGMEALAICDREGVQMGFGTDLLGDLHRYQCEEFRIRAEVLPALTILRSATSVNAKLLNQTGQLGVIAPEAFADLIVVDGNPLVDLSRFTESGEHIHLIMKNGTLYKNLLQ